MNLQALLQKHAELCDQQQAIVDKAATELRGMTEDEKTQFNALQVEVDGLAETIASVEAMQARATALGAPGERRFVPGDPSASNHRLDNGGFSNVGEFIDALRFGDPKGRLHSLPTGQGEGGGKKMPEALAVQIMPWRFPEAAAAMGIRNEWSMGVGQEGGFAVPTQQYTGDVMMIKPEDAIVRPRANVIEPGNPPDGSIPIPAFTQGDAGVFGGVTVQWIGEGARKPETDGELREVILTPKEVAGHTVASDKLLRNWGAANRFISNLLRGAVIHGEDLAFLRGNGANRPFGVQGCPGRVLINRVVANQIGWIDVSAMLSRLLPESVSSALWVCNQSAMPQIVNLTDPAGNLIFLRGDATKGIPSTLAGIPIKFTGKTSALGQLGDLMLVDFRYYLIKDGSGPFVAASEHVWFRENKTVIKVFWNVDGNGWIDQPMLLDDGQTRVSAYIVLDVPAV